jgi:hypothetical protein
MADAWGGGFGDAFGESFGDSGAAADPGHVFQCNVFQNNVFQGVCGVAPAVGGYVPGFWTEEHRKIKEREEGVPEPIEALSKLPEFIAPKTWGDDDEEDELSELIELMEIMDHASI